MKLILIGNGKQGKNFIKTISEMKDIELKVATKENWKELVGQKPDGVIIATQPNKHIDIALYALQKEIPCLIEKPLALTVDECLKLKPYEDKIMVNYTYLFDPEFEKIPMWQPGTLVYACAYGPVKRDYSAEVDYGCHAWAMLFDKQAPEYPPPVIGAFPLNSFKFWLRKINDGNIVDHIYEADRDRPIMPFVINNFIRLINGEKDRRFGVDMSIEIMKKLT